MAMSVLQIANILKEPIEKYIGCSKNDRVLGKKFNYWP